MKYLYDEIEKSGRIPGAYDTWKDYREKVTNFLISTIIEPGDSLAVFGSGECNDLDLQKLAGTADSITCIDKYHPDYRDIFYRQKVKDGDIYHITETLAGVERDYILVFEEYLQKEKNAEDILSLLCEIKKEIEKKPERLIDRRWKVGICFGLHSQLVSGFAAVLEKYKDYYKKADREKIIHGLRMLNQVTVKKLNDLLFTCCKKVSIGYEYSIFPQGCSLEKMKQILEEYETGKIEVISKEMPYRIEGAWQCERDLAERYKEGQLAVISWKPFCWPFLEEKKYLLNILNVIPGSKL